MITIKELREAVGRSVTVSWDMGDPNTWAGDWQDQGIYLDDWNKRKGEIIISGTEKALFNWLVGDYGLSKKDAHLEIFRGKKIKL
tara:strand:+ start:180 stop:434 length:255 start_codon:yes stop_codon:yes gene_type:complete